MRLCGGVYLVGVDNLMISGFQIEIEFVVICCFFFIVFFLWVVVMY